MDDCTMLRFAGFGGQGIVKAGEIFGAAAVADGKRALQNESYGSSARGGLCTSDVVVGASAIHEVEPGEFDVLVAFNQDSCNAFLPHLRAGGTLVFESDLVRLPEGFSGRSHGLPATRIAADDLGRRIVANMIVLGFSGAITKLVSRASLDVAVRSRVPAGTEELNMRAVAEGWRRGEESLRQHVR